MDHGLNLRRDPSRPRRVPLFLMMRFLHCSDVHITEDYSKVPLLKLGWRRWMALAELRLGRAAAFANADASLSKIARLAELERVDHLIVTGDVTA